MWLSKDSLPLATSKLYTVGVQAMLKCLVHCVRAWMLMFLYPCVESLLRTGLQSLSEESIFWGGGIFLHLRINSKKHCPARLRFSISSLVCFMAKLFVLVCKPQGHNYFFLWAWSSTQHNVSTQPQINHPNNSHKHKSREHDSTYL